MLRQTSLGRIDMTDKDRQMLKKFFERNPHPPWMNDNRYFQNEEDEHGDR